MNTLTRERVQLHCRTCLCDLETKVDEIGLPRRWYHLMTTKNLAIWIRNFTSLEVLRSDENYPQFICHDCYDKFKDFTEFQELVWKAAKKLDEVLIETYSNKTSATPQLECEKLATVVKSEIDSEEEDEANDENELLSDECSGDIHIESYENNMSESTEVIHSENAETERFLTANNEQKLRGDDFSPLANKIYKCERCNRSYANEYTYKEHIRQEHQGITSAFECEFCSRSYTKFCDLYRHMRQDHNTGLREFKCEYSDCNHSFRHLSKHRKNNQELHQYRKRPSTPPTPPDSTLLLPELLLSTNLPPPPVSKKRFFCSLCSEEFETQYNLQNHMVTHRDDLKFECHLCGKRKISQLKLDEHYATVHDPKHAYPCNICHKVFKCKSHVSVHILSVHKGLRPFACHYCPMQFAAKNTLKIHERLHTGEKPFACEICGRRFTQLTPMKKHRLTHDKERGNEHQIHQQQLMQPIPHPQQLHPPLMPMPNFSILGN